MAGCQTFISRPLENQLVNPKDPLVVEGFFTCSYSVSWGVGENPGEWTDEGVELSEIVGELAVIEAETFSLQASGYYTLRLIPEGGNPILIPVYADIRLKSGFPKPLAGKGPPGSYGRVLVDDLIPDQCGKEIFCTSRNGGLVWIYDADGTELHQSFLSEGGTLAPSSADLDGNGSREIVVPSLPVIGEPLVRVSIFQSDLTLIRQFDVTEIGSAIAGVVLQDLDGDGQVELIFSGFGFFGGKGAFWLTVFDAFGNRRPGFPRRINREVHQQGYSSSVFFGAREPIPAVGNFDEDPQLEIAVLGGEQTDFQQDPNNTTTSYLSCFNDDGSLVPGWPRVLTVKIGGGSFLWCFASPATVDWDGDGRDEIVTGSSDGIHVFQGDGTIQSGWPQASGGDNLVPHFALGDLRGQGRPSVIATVMPGTLVGLIDVLVFDPEGNLSDFLVQSESWPLTGPVTFDANGDGAMEVVLPLPDPLLTTQQFRLNTYGPGAPLELMDSHLIPNSLPIYSAGVSDFENDGVAEIVIIASIDSNHPYLYIFDSPFDPGPVRSHWASEHATPGRTGRFSSKGFLYFRCGRRWHGE